MPQLWTSRRISKFIALALLASASMSVYADITSTGEVLPSDASTWNSTTLLTVGASQSGQLDITAGSSVSVNSTAIGFNSGVSGVLNVDASTLNNSYSLVVGSNGTGTLNITGGAVVTNQTGVAGGYWSGAGAITVAGPGSKWVNTGNLMINRGSLTIKQGGQVSYSGSNSGIGPGASIEVTGDSSTLSSDSWLTVYGSLQINSGARVQTGTGFIIGGMQSPSSVASVVVDGGNSRWKTSDILIGSNYGSGTAPSTLTIMNGAKVEAAGATYVGSQFTGADGQILVGAGGTLVTQSLYASKGQIVGNGVVTTKGIVTDGELRFDSAHAQRQTLNWNVPGSTIAVDIDVSQSNSRGNLGIGWHGTGSMVVKDGVTVYSDVGRIGYGFGSSGQVTVEGTDSQWYTNSLEAGTAGGAELNVHKGGKVYIQNSSTLGATSLAKTIVRVDGQGSFLDMGNATLASTGRAVLHVTNGAIASAQSLTVGAKGLVIVDVGNGSLLGVGGGVGLITNNGTVRLIAAHNAASGSYHPLNVLGIGASGTYQFLGGKWNTGAQVFTITQAQHVSAGESISIDRSVTQRLVVTDQSSQKVVELNLAGTDPSNAALFQVSMMNTPAAIQGQNILAAWNLDVTGDAPGAININMGVGTGYDVHALSVWRYESGEWKAFDVDDLSYDSGFANFTVTDMGAYAVSVAVPEPATLVMLAGAGAMMMRRRKN